MLQWRARECVNSLSAGQGQLCAPVDDVVPVVVDAKVHVLLGLVHHVVLGPAGSRSDPIGRSPRRASSVLTNAPLSALRCEPSTSGDTVGSSTLSNVWKGCSQSPHEATYRLRTKVRRCIGANGSGELRSSPEHMALLCQKAVAVSSRPNGPRPVPRPFPLWPHWGCLSTPFDTSSHRLSRCRAFEFGSILRWPCAMGLRDWAATRAADTIYSVLHRRGDLYGLPVIRSFRLASPARDPTQSRTGSAFDTLQA